MIFHQPRFPWNKGISLTKPPFGVRSCEVAIIWPDVWSTFFLSRTAGGTVSFCGKKHLEPVNQSMRCRMDFNGWFWLKRWFPNVTVAVSPKLIPTLWESLEIMVSTCCFFKVPALWLELINFDCFSCEWRSNQSFGLLCFTSSSGLSAKLMCLGSILIRRWWFGADSL